MSIFALCFSEPPLKLYQTTKTRQIISTITPLFLYSFSNFPHMTKHKELTSCVGKRNCFRCRWFLHYRSAADSALYHLMFSSRFVVALLLTYIDVGQQLQWHLADPHKLHPIPLAASCTLVIQPQQLTQSRWMAEMLQEWSVSYWLPGLFACLSMQWAVVLAHTVQ